MKNLVLGFLGGAAGYWLATLAVTAVSWNAIVENGLGGLVTVAVAASAVKFIGDVDKAVNS